MMIHSQLARLSTAHGQRAGSAASTQPAQVGADSATALSNLQGKALERLAREIPGMDAQGLQKLDPADYTPEKIADRIGGFVAAGLESARARGKSEEEIQALYDSAVKGVQKGFAEAKDILSNLKVLNGDIAEQVKATETSTFDRLAELSPSKQKPPTTGTAGTAGTASLGIAQRYRQAEAFDLTLKTREGDEVKISFSHASDVQGSFAAISDAEGNGAAILDLSRSEASGYRFSVQGDLSADEIDAIQSLVQDVGDLANEFFNGDVQKAFEQAPDVSFDSSQLASMRLHMSRSEQYSAVQRYQQAQQPDNPDQARSGLRLGHLARELSNAAQNPLLAFLDKANEAANQLMQGLVAQDGRFKDASEEQQSRFQDRLGQLLAGSRLL